MNKVLPVIVCAGIVLNVVAFSAGRVFAAGARVLNDSELDSVYAEGLSFNFDVSLSKMNSFLGDGILPERVASGSVNVPLGDSALDAQTGAGTQIQFNIVPGDASSMLLGTGSGMNTVIVGENSQQFLSSLVNINAAGSFVPVLINIVINFDSNIGNLSTVNSLGLDDSLLRQFR